MPTGRGRTDPLFYLTAAPLQRIEIPTLFEPDGVVTILEEPPTLRPPTLGWDLWTLDRPRFVEGRKTFLANGYRKRLALYTGGSLTFVGGFIEFLGWPRSPASLSSRRKFDRSIPAASAAAVMFPAFFSSSVLR